MTAVETSEFYGYERFVIVRPRTCRTCGHKFDLDSKAGRALLRTLIVIGAVLMVLLLSLGVIAPWFVWREQPFVSDRLVITVLAAGVAVGAIGVILVRAARTLERLRA